MTPFQKIGIAIAGIGIIGGIGGLGAYISNIYTPIKSRLSSEGFDTNLTSADWDQLLEAHNKVHDGNIFKASNNETRNKEWLINKCKDALKKDEKDRTNYLLARQWCVKETNVGSVLNQGKKKYRLLRTNEGSEEEDKTEWIIKISNLRDNDFERRKLGVQLGVGETPNIIAMKRVCIAVVATKTTDKEFNTKLELAKDWCVV